MTELLTQYLEQAAEIAYVWGPFLIFFFMAVESSAIPFPSEVVMVPAGFMIARNEMFPGDPLPAALLAIFCGTAGSLAGAFANYYVALFVGRPFLYKYGKWFFLKPHALRRSEEIFIEYGDIATFICRLLPGIRELISIPAGLARMKLKRFSIFTTTGAGIWVTILTGIGYHFGRQAKEMTYAELVTAGEAMLRKNYIWILGGCAMAVLVYAWIHHRVMQSRKTHMHKQPHGLD